VAVAVVLVAEEDAEITSCVNAPRKKVLSIKVVAAINDVKRRGHDAHLYKHDGKVWVEIDQCMLASFAEIEELVDGVQSFEELAEVFKKRHAQVLC
jgi:hypothetical protein